MNALYHGSTQRIATTGSAVARNDRDDVPMSVHRTSRRRQLFFTLLAWMPW